MRPETALEQQALLRDYLDRMPYKQYVTDFLDKDKLQFIVLGQEENNNDLSVGIEFCKWERDRLQIAESYFVSESMVDLVKWAALQLPDDVQWTHDMWPSDYGFVWFDKSYMFKDVQGVELPLRAISWGRTTFTKQNKPVEPNTTVIYYQDGDETPNHRADYDEYDAWARRVLGRLQMTHTDVLLDGHQIGQATFKASDLSEDFVNKLTEQVKYFRSQYNDFDTESAQKFLDGKFAVQNVSRIIMAVVLLMNQTVTDVAEYTDRRVAKRMRRMRMPERVTVVRLRRVHKVHQMEGESNVEWMHRWVVKGHWRNQPYHDKDTGEVYYRRIWIAPYVKGPEDKPFKQSTKVYGLVR